MSKTHYRFGKATIAKLNNPEELKQLLVGPLFDCEHIIIKPNWVSTDPADFTDADTLRILLESIGTKITITESYCLARSLNILENGLNFIANGKVVNWRWLLKGEGWKWLIQNPDWDWFIKGEHWSQIRREEKAFLDKFGFSDLFREFNVSYVNVTEEVWNGRTANPIEVKRLVESRFKPVQTEKIYGMVPKRLYDMRGSTFISFARLKMYASFTMKNLFGMIPDPLRAWWHGPKDSMIARSIIDINKIYHALFNVYGICEALNTRAVIHPEGEFEGIYSGRYNTESGLGFLACSRDLFFLDALLLELTDPSRRLITEINRASIDLAEEEFGTIDRNTFAEAKAKVGSWL